MVSGDITNVYYLLCALNVKLLILNIVLTTNILHMWVTCCCEIAVVELSRIELLKITYRNWVIELNCGKHCWWCHYSTVGTLCNQHLLQSDTIKKKNLSFASFTLVWSPQTPEETISLCGIKTEIMVCLKHLDIINTHTHAPCVSPTSNSFFVCGTC